MLIQKLAFSLFGYRFDTGENVPSKSIKKNKRENPFKGNITKSDSNSVITIEVKDSFDEERKELENSEPQTRNNPVRKIVPDRNFNFSLDIEKIPGKGEDAPPILLQFADHTTILGVADGMGGAGGTVYEIDNDKRSGAYLASRIINSITEKYFISFKESGYSISEDNSENIGEDLKKHFNSGLIQILEKIEKQGNLKINIKSSLIKRLPTTFVLSYLIPHENNVEVYNYWAGDSRVYLLDPFTGLHQLTEDDLTGKNDAFDNLISDSRISNCVNADSPYKININRNILNNTPKIIFASTDGAFGYLQTPVHFEYILLRTLQDSASIDIWKSNLQKVYKNGQSDDISISLSILGCKSFWDLKDLFKRRYELLQKDIQDIDALLREIEFAESSLGEINKKNDFIVKGILDFENQIKIKTENVNYLEREINDSEYEIKRMDNQVEDLKIRISELQKKSDTLKRNIQPKLNELEKAKDELLKDKEKSKQFKEQNESLDNKLIVEKVMQIKVLKQRANLDLWLKYKSVYEQYLKN